ncbi:MAG: nitroreductase [Flavobacteriales bacterium]|nr:nitroreductase [Flavobacteriales bacterium]
MKYNLSEITHLIRNRRSVAPEQYSSRKVHREQLELILTNGTWAPNHGMTQPWRYKVFMEDGMKKLEDFLPDLYRSKTPAEKFKESKFERLKSRLAHVSAVVVICMERDKSGKIPENEEIEAVACSVQNMMLTAVAYGLACYWSTPGFIYSDEMKQFLGLQDQDRCLGLFYVGYPGGEWPQSHRKPLEYVTEWFTE